MGRTDLTRLLTRDEFREGVFARDKHQCVICHAPAVDAHHIIERKLWPDGGYYLDNGASVCEEHHIVAEQTVLPCETLRMRCGITRVLLPPHLYRDVDYDKWGNPYLPTGRRAQGELFDDPSVQKILAAGGMLNLFDARIKYPRTYHLPWSPGGTDDDRVQDDLSAFEGQEIVVTVKMDGENTTIVKDGVYARSRDTETHWSRDWVRGLGARIGFEMPDNWRLCGENLYAKHSIAYQNLPSYFLLFSIWNGLQCLSWDETVSYAAILDLQTVPVLYRGPWDRKLIEGLYKPLNAGEACEGYVVRVARPFHMAEFRRVVGKYVRQNHVVTHGHWMRTNTERNELAS